MIVMKIVIYAVLMAVIFAGCKGEKGDVGPQGSQGIAGEKGAVGATGPQGTPGQNATLPKVYDFALRFGKSQPSSATFSKIGTLSQYDYILIYATTNRDKDLGVAIRSMLPYDGGLLYESKFYFPVAFKASYGTSGNVYIESSNVFDAVDVDFRVVVIKGEKGGRINTERYHDYENLKADFGLKD
mgnify:CR=1 FL=1